MMSSTFCGVPIDEAQDIIEMFKEHEPKDKDIRDLKRWMDEGDVVFNPTYSRRLARRLMIRILAQKTKINSLEVKLAQADRIVILRENVEQARLALETELETVL